MLKHQLILPILAALISAAFRRLCVETQMPALRFISDSQPPSGGCVLKPCLPPDLRHLSNQPPSGGCVLKPGWGGNKLRPRPSAAFRRLCVETPNLRTVQSRYLSAAFRRLCVETENMVKQIKGSNQPPSGGCVLKPSCIPCCRLSRYQPPSGGCVLKLPVYKFVQRQRISRLQAAVC